jgi:hypothetical protein
MWLREFTASEFVTVNKRLNPKIWQDDELDPAVADKLKENVSIVEGIENAPNLDKFDKEERHGRVESTHNLRGF